MTDFSVALVLVREGRWVRRDAWTDGQAVAMESRRDEPRLRMKNAHGNVSPWVWTPATEDLFADDWRLA